MSVNSQNSIDESLHDPSQGDPENHQTPILKDHHAAYRLKPCITPLPSQKKKSDESLDKDKKSPLIFGTTSIRPENEDDDGYDPYSDFHPQAEFFEENPWD